MGPTAGLDGCWKFRTTEIRSPDLPAPCESPYRLRIIMTILLLLLLLLVLPLQHHHREASEISRLKEKLTKIRQPRAIYIVPLALSTTGIIPSPSKETIWQFETAQSSPCSTYSHAESNTIEYMPCSSEVLSRIMHTQCFVSGPHCFKPPKPLLIQNIIIIIIIIIIMCVTFHTNKCLWLLRKMQPRLLNLSLLR